MLFVDALIPAIHSSAHLPSVLSKCPKKSKKKSTKNASEIGSSCTHAKLKNKAAENYQALSTQRERIEKVGLPLLTNVFSRLMCSALVNLVFFTTVFAMIRELTFSVSAALRPSPQEAFV